MSEVTFPCKGTTAVGFSFLISHNFTLLSKCPETIVVNSESDTAISLQLDPGNRVFVPTQKKNGNYILFKIIISIIK